MSAIADAGQYAQQARRSAEGAGEIGAAFDLLVVGKILEDDVQVHERIASQSGDIVGELGAILEDGKVSADEVKRLATIKRRVGFIGKLAAI